MAALLVIQPLLDVLSYFMQEAGSTAFTTGLRLSLLFLVSLYGFAVSDRKGLYLGLYALIGGFWVLHALNCFRVGYQRPMADAAEYLKLVQFPLWTAAFLTFFRRRQELRLRVIGVLALNFAIILLVIGLSYLVGRPVYTYDYPERNIQIGVMGWFGVHSAQSAIVCILTPPLLLWGLKTEKLWVFCLCALSGLGLLFFTGTRLCYYAAILIALAFSALILVSRKQLWFCAPLLAALVLLVACRGLSPMAERAASTGRSVEIYGAKIQELAGDVESTPGEKPSAEDLEIIETVYREIYGKEGVFGETLLKDLIDRFGIERVMEEYDYTLDPAVLNDDVRGRKLKALHMIWEEEDFLTRLLGFEYGKVLLGENNYDPENDFPALLYYTGYLGTALYGAFLLWVLGYGAVLFFRKFPALLTAEFGTPVLMTGLALGAALLSGNVLRRPNVSVYLALGAALLLFCGGEAPSEAKLRPGHEGNPAVSTKKI